MRTFSLPDQTPSPGLSTNVIDRINFAIAFEKYCDMAIKRWWVIAIAMAVALSYSGYKAYKEPDIFMARGSMMVKPRINISKEEIYGEEALNFYGTQVELMKSTAVLEAVRQQLADDNHSASLNVFQLKNTSIFNLTATSTSHEYAKRYLDAVMNEYINYKRKLRNDVSDNAEANIQQLVDGLDKERLQFEAELFGFQKDNNITFYEEQRTQAAQYMSELNRQVADLRTERELLDFDRISPERIKSGTDGSGTSTNQITESVSGARGLKTQADTTSIKNQLSVLRGDREDLSKYLRPAHPKIIRLDAEIESKERLLKMAQDQTKDEIANYRESLQKQEEVLVKSLDRWEKKAMEANQKAAQYDLIKANLLRVKELHAFFLKQLQEISLLQKTQPEVIAINEAAKSSPVPIGPNRTRDILFAALMGIVVSVVIILVLERFDDRVKTIEELQEMLPETVLGQIPMIPSRDASEMPLLMMDLPPHSTFAESFRNVRSSLRFSPLANAAKTIGVTSAIPGDGKTTCSVNLAICLAQIEKGRTLLIDADMRKMNVHKYFKMENGPGLSEVLSGQARLSECVVPTDVPGLDVLRAGTVPPNPGELILSENFKALLAEAGQLYQRIIIDTPPVLATDDTLSLAPVIDGVIFVVKAKQTSLRFVDKSMNLLKQRGTRIFGLVLNQIDTSSARYYYYYYYANYYQASDGQKKSA